MVCDGSDCCLLVLFGKNLFLKLIIDVWFIDFFIWGNWVCEIVIAYALFLLPQFNYLHLTKKSRGVYFLVYLWVGIAHICLARPSSSKARLIALGDNWKKLIIFSDFLLVVSFVILWFKKNKNSHHFFSNKFFDNKTKALLHWIMHIN